MSQFETGHELPGSLPFRLHKGRVPGHTRRRGDAIDDPAFSLELPADFASFTFDRDEVQTIVDFLIEVLEETAEPERKPLTLDDLEVGKVYEVVADNSNHGIKIGSKVVYVGKGGPNWTSGHLITVDPNVAEWESEGSGPWHQYGACRAIRQGDLAEATFA